MRGSPTGCTGARASSVAQSTKLAHSKRRPTTLESSHKVPMLRLFFTAVLTGCGAPRGPISIFHGVRRNLHLRRGKRSYSSGRCHHDAGRGSSGKHLPRRRCVFWRVSLAPSHTTILRKRPVPLRGKVGAGWNAAAFNLCRRSGGAKGECGTLRCPIGNGF